jgi:hypothetical protein
MLMRLPFFLLVSMLELYVVRCGAVSNVWIEQQS